MQRFSLSLLLASLALSGCATVSMGASRPPSQSDQQLVERAWPYAQLAYNVYHRERIDPEARPFLLPEGYEYERLQYGNDEIGLAFEVAVRRVPTKEVIFVFRGTEGGPGLKNCDWIRGNFARRQQERAARIVKKYVLEHAIDDKQLVFVGHSLGGAIATQLSYDYPNSRTYIFNPSPMFRGSILPQDDQQFERRLSIVNRGEFLYFARGPMREATQTYLPVNCGGGLSPITRHSIFRLATCLTRRAANAEQPSDMSALAKNSLKVNETQFTAMRMKIDPTNPTQLCPKGRPIADQP